MVMVMKRTIVMVMKRVMGKKAFEQQEGREGAEAVITFQTSSSPWENPLCRQFSHLHHHHLSAESEHDDFPGNTYLKYDGGEAVAI